MDIFSDFSNFLYLFASSCFLSLGLFILPKGYSSGCWHICGTCDMCAVCLKCVSSSMQENNISPSHRKGPSRREIRLHDFDKAEIVALMAYFYAGDTDFPASSTPQIRRFAKRWYFYSLGFGMLHFLYKDIWWHTLCLCLVKTISICLWCEFNLWLICHLLLRILSGICLCTVYLWEPKKSDRSQYI